MTARRSLRFRLVAGAAVWVATALVICGLLLSELFRRYAEDAFAAELATHLDQMVALVQAGADGRPALRHPLSDPRFTRPFSGLYWEVASETGIAVLRSRSLWDAALPLPRGLPADGDVHRHDVPGPQGERLLALERSVALPDAENRYRLAVAADRRGVDHLIGHFARTLAWSLGALGLGLVAAAAVQVHVGLRPLNGLRRGLAAIRAGRASRLEGSHPHELAPLVADLNALLDHYREAVQRARTQTGGLAHGLKTPLAVIANESEALGRAGRKDEAAVIRQQVEAMRRQIDYHLARARAAAAVGLPGVLCPVAEPVADIRRTLERLFAERGLTFHAEVPEDLLFAGDRQDLEEILGNVMENSCKWAKARVDVTGGAEDGFLLLVIDDDGPGIPDDRAEEVFEPGARLDDTVPGSGLGLAIARDLVLMYRGGIKVERSPAGGTRVVIRLPRSTAR